MGTQTQQRELWVYLAITWWIGSLAAWLVAWFSNSSTQPNDSLLTATGLLLLGVGACLRLPVLTTQTPTTSIEDHFVWLLAASANLNWIGYLGLNAASIAAVVPAVLIGVALEWWLWNEAGRSDCLSWARMNLLKPLGRSLGDSRIGKLPDSSVVSALATPSHSLPAEKQGPHQMVVAEQAMQGAQSQAFAESCPERNVVHRTYEDGIDPTGRRYMAGEITLDWHADQRAQTIVVGFVPAFSGDPQVELEVNCDECTAQVVNCTPAGMRIQLKRIPSSSEPIQEPTNLAWYAEQTDASPSPSPSGGSLS